MNDETKLRVRVEAERCQGHNRCYAIAPELFQIDAYGNSTAAGDGVVLASIIPIRAGTTTLI